MAEPLAALAQRYAEPDMRAALAQYMQSLLSAPAPNITAPQPQPVNMPNLSMQDYGRFRQTGVDYNVDNLTARGNYNTYDGKPSGWGAMLGYRRQF